MNNAIIVLLVLTLLPILFSWISGYYRYQQFGQVDNKNPRGQSALLVGAGARAVAAQQNAWEALAIYMAALLALNVAQVPAEQYGCWVLAYAALRVAHGLFYLLNIGILRSLAFVGAYAIAIYLFCLAL